jgi:HEAT repeat protein
MTVRLMSTNSQSIVAATVTTAMLAVTVACARESAPADRLLDEFEKTSVSWRQLDIARQIVRTGDQRAVQRLAPWLDHEDRHLRGNAAFVLAALGDDRGFQTIVAMVTDRSARPEGQGIPNAGFSVARQIRTDRYYAVHLLGELKNPRAVDLLLPLLNDTDVNDKVAWTLAEIGDERARAPLIAALDDRDAHARVSAIQALVKLNAVEALPKLHELLSDDELPSAGDRVPVAETARAAIAEIEKSRRARN